MTADELWRQRKENPTHAELQRLGWYHAFRFEDGTEFPGALAVEVSQARYAKFPIPSDLSGQRVLDIGAWDGWFSFEAERHGASVTAIDTVEMDNFHTVHRKLASKVIYRELDLFEVPNAQIGKFQIVFFLGVIYHTKYPLLALEIVCGLTLDTAIVESYVTDADTWAEHLRDIPTLEFYETDELGGQLDNWCGPTVGCLKALARAAGFARVDLIEAGGNRAALACYRKWDFAPDASRPRARLLSVKNTIRKGINFRALRDEYMTWWFEDPNDSLGREEILLEVAGFGVPAMYVSRGADGRWAANSRLPPGMVQGWHEVRISVAGSPWSLPRRIAVDLPIAANSLTISALYDGRTWEKDAIEMTDISRVISCWVSGLPDNSDEANTAVLVDGNRTTVQYVGPPDEHQARQINAELAAGVEPGRHNAVVRFAGVESEPRAFVARGPAR